MVHPITCFHQYIPAIVVAVPHLIPGYRANPDAFARFGPIAASDASV